MKITLKPLIKKNSWAGLTRYNKCQDSISPYFNSRGLVETGLTEEEAKELGEKLGQDLAPHSPYWIDFRVVMSDKAVPFDTANPLHELIYKFLLSHKRVANSLLELDQYPHADYVITNETNEAKKQNIEFNIELEAFKEFAKLTPEDMRNVLKLYPGNAKYGNADTEIVQAKLAEQMKKDPETFVAIVKDKLKDSKIFLKDLVDARILRKNKQAYYYGEDCIGHDIESTITYVNDPSNQSLKVALKQALESIEKKSKK